VLSAETLKCRIDTNKKQMLLTVCGGSCDEADCHGLLFTWNSQTSLAIRKKCHPKDDDKDPASAASDPSNDLPHSSRHKSLNSR